MTLADERLIQLTRELGTIDERVAQQRALIEQARRELAEFCAERDQVAAALAARRKELAQELGVKVMARVDQEMTRPEIARALHISVADVQRAIREFRQTEGHPTARRRPRIPERRSVKSPMLGG